MRKLFKYLKLIATFRQVADEYKRDNGTDKPLILSRRLFGLLFTVIGGLVAELSGTPIFPLQVDILADNTKTVVDALQVSIPHLIELYGVIMTIVGTIRRKK